MGPFERQPEDTIITPGLDSLPVYGMAFVSGPWTCHQDSWCEFFFSSSEDGFLLSYPHSYLVFLSSSGMSLFGGWQGELNLY